MALLNAPSSLAVTGAKALLGLFVFSTIMLGWWLYQDDITRRMPLPGADKSGGRCSVWFAGSSTFHRWKSVEADMAPWQAHNRGVEGAMVQDIASRLEIEKVEKAPGTIVFYIGENDIAHGASAEQASAEAQMMVAAVQRRMPRTKIVVLGMKPSPMRWHLRDEQLRYNGFIESFLRSRRNAVFVDFGDALLVGGKPGAYYDEGGIHLNAAGYAVWAREMRKALGKLPLAASCAARRR